MSVGKALTARQLAARPRGDTLLTPQFAIEAFGGVFDIWRAAGGDNIARGLGRELSIDAFAVQGEPALIAVAYQGQEAIEIWSLAEARRINTLPIRSKAFRIAFSPRGDQIAVVHGQRAEGAGRYDPLDYILEIRSVLGGDRIAEIPLGTLEPRFLSFLPDGQRLLFATGDWQFPNDIHVVDPSDASSMVTLEDVREVDALRLAPDGEHLAIRDGPRVRIWNVTTGRAVAQLPTNAFIAAVGFSPDGRYLATASRDNDLTLWSWRSEDLIDRACRHLVRNLGRKEWQDFLPDMPYRPTCPNLPIEDLAEQNPTTSPETSLIPNQ